MAKKKGRGGRREGAGRKPVLKDADRVAFAIPGRLLAKLDKRAAKEGINRSEAARAAIEAWVS